MKEIKKSPDSIAAYKEIKDQIKDKGREEFLPMIEIGADKLPEEKLTEVKPFLDQLKKLDDNGVKDFMEKLDKKVNEK